jgi:hypothetical protein
MFRRRSQRFALIAVLIAAIALPGSILPGAQMRVVDAFFLCTANGARAGGEPLRDEVPGSDHAAGGVHCPLCLTHAGAVAFTAPAAGVLAALAPETALVSPAPLAAGTRPLERVRGQPPPFPSLA